MQHLTELTNTIAQRLSPAKLRSYAHLMQEFRFRRIDRQKLVKSVLLLLEHDQDLLRRFLEVVYDEFSLPSTEEDQEEEEGELEEGEIRDRTKGYHDFDLNQDYISDDDDEILEGEIRGGNNHHNYGNDEHDDDDGDDDNEEIAGGDCRDDEHNGDQIDEKKTGERDDHHGGHIDEKKIGNIDYHHDHRDDEHNGDHIDDKMIGNRRQIDDKKTGTRDDHQSYRNNEHSGGDYADDKKTEDKATIGAAVDENPKEDVSAKDEMNMGKFTDLYNKIKKIGLEGKNKGIYEELTNMLMPNREKKLTPHELKHQILSIFSDRHHLRNEILEFIDDAELITRQEAVRSQKKRNKSTPIKDWKRVTPSYRLIPEENQSLVPDPELNNKYVSVGQRRGRRWYQKRRSVHEKVMFQCEEEMYEADMLRGTLQRAVEKAEKVLEGKMKMEDVGIMFYRCIERVYGERGEEAVEEVKQEPEKALCVILPRLKRKLREVTLALEGREPIWKQLFQEHSKKQEDSTARPEKQKIS